MELAFPILCNQSFPTTRIEAWRPICSVQITFFSSSLLTSQSFWIFIGCFWLIYKGYNFLLPSLCDSYHDSIDENAFSWSSLLLTLFFCRVPIYVARYWNYNYEWRVLNGKIFWYSIRRCTKLLRFLLLFDQNTLCTSCCQIAQRTFSKYQSNCLLPRNLQSRAVLCFQNLWHYQFPDTKFFSAKSILPAVNWVNLTNEEERRTRISQNHK